MSTHHRKQDLYWPRSDYKCIEGISPADDVYGDRMLQTAHHMMSRGRTTRFQDGVEDFEDADESVLVIGDVSGPFLI